jgi:hypothetical protein
VLLSTRSLVQEETTWRAVQDECSVVAVLSGTPTLPIYDPAAAIQHISTAQARGCGSNGVSGLIRRA